MDSIIVQTIQALTNFASDYLILGMFIMFVISVGVKMVIHYMAQSYHRFSIEFEKRVHRHLEGAYEDTQNKSFQDLSKLLLERTYHEAYVLREMKALRSLDKTATLIDRVLLVQEGVRRMIYDTLKQIRYYKKGEDPNFQNVTKFVYGTNNHMNNVIGKFPIYVINNFLNILPGLFIIGGIFGTFLGITQGLPELKAIDPSNAEMAKTTMGMFLDKMAFSMNTSLIGIGFSVFFTILNNIFSENKIKSQSMERFFHAIEFIWKDSKEHKKTGQGLDLDNVLNFTDAESNKKSAKDKDKAA